MAYFLQQLVNGLTLGSVYGLIAIGYTMVYGIIGMINFAHGEIYMIGAFVAVIIFTAFQGLPIVVAILLVLLFSVIITSVYGWTVERLAYRPLRNSFKLAPLISAIGMSIFLQNYMQLAQGARNKAIPPLFLGGFDIWEDGDFVAKISYIQLFIIVFTIIIMVIFNKFINSTTIGRQQRACEQDKTMAALLGVNVDRTVSLTFIMGAALAAIAGILVSAYYGVINFYIGFLAGLKAFTAAVLGGIGSLPGAMLGGIIIGLIEAFWAGYFSAEWKDVAAFTILVIVLIFRPSGILGRPEVEKV